MARRVGALKTRGGRLIHLADDSRNRHGRVLCPRLA